MQVNSLHPLARTGLNCAIDQLRAALSQPLSEEHVVFTLDPVASELVITALDTTAGGAVGKYRGVARFAYGKARLSQVLPYPVLCKVVYPTTYRLLKQWLREQYNLLLEEGEFALASNPTQGLAGDDPIAVAPNESNSVIELIALPTSGRWVSGGTLRLIVVGNVLKKHLNDLIQFQLAGDIYRITDAQHSQYFSG